MTTINPIMTCVCGPAAPQYGTPQLLLVESTQQRDDHDHHHFNHPLLPPLRLLFLVDTADSVVVVVVNIWNEDIDRTKHHHGITLPQKQHETIPGY